MFSKILDFLILLLNFIVSYQQAKKDKVKNIEDYNNKLKDNIEKGNLDELLK